MPRYGIQLTRLPRGTRMYVPYSLFEVFVQFVRTYTKIVIVTHSLCLHQRTTREKNFPRSRRKNFFAISSIDRIKKIWGNSHLIFKKFLIEWFYELWSRGWKKIAINAKYKNKSDTVDRTSLKQTTMTTPPLPHYHLRSGSENFSFVILLPTPFPYHDYLRINIHLSFSRRNKRRLEKFSRYEWIFYHLSLSFFFFKSDSYHYHYHYI